jgi:hypothetical protein
MRLQPVDPKSLTSEQRPLYDDMKSGIEQNFTAFRAIGDRGELIGP